MDWLVCSVVYLFIFLLNLFGCSAMFFSRKGPTGIYNSTIAIQTTI